MRLLKHGFGPLEPGKFENHFACRLLLFSHDSGQAAEDSVADIATLLILEKKFEHQSTTVLAVQFIKVTKAILLPLAYISVCMLIFLYVTCTERERKSKRSCVREERAY